MLIELEEPFKSVWKNGYLVNDSEGRKRVMLYNNPSDRFGVTLARYRMCVKIGYILPTELEVDHIDNDKSNDDIGNLQILTKQQNIDKQNLYYIMHEQISCGYHCACCDLPFIISTSEKKKRLGQGQTLAFCSRECAASYHGGIGEEDIQKIKLLRQEGNSSYKISAATGFARNTVMKYW